MKPKQGGALSARIDHLALMMAGLERWGELWLK